ncbi:hypothetical protein MTO96_047867 [Rhipicephalus appendiculatus]
MDSGENWEHEIAPGCPGYVPTGRPTFKSTMGMKRHERKRFYQELLKQAEMRNQMQDLEEKLEALRMQRSAEAAASCEYLTEEANFRTLQGE